jgi:hypothetical protein
MDREKLGEVISAGLASAEVVEAEHLLPVFSDQELLAEVEKRQLATGSLALESTLQTGLESSVDSPEAPTPEHAPLAESLRASFDTAYQSYGLLVNVANGVRAEAKGRKKPAQLEAVDAKTIRADVEALLANPDFMSELQTEIDHFTKHPEVGSPEAGFNLIIVPEGLTTADEQAAARNIQTKIPSRYKEPYIRPAGYNDPRTPEVTGKGYRLAVAPRHYNVPKGTASIQTNWMNTANQRTTATELQTATDAEALAAINNLVNDNELDNPATRFDQTYFRRFDQAPVGDRVSDVGFYGDGWLDLDRSHVHDDNPARALVVPKA